MIKLRASRLLALGILTMLMTGCIKVDMALQLHGGDNTVSGSMVFAVSRDLLALTGSSADALLGQMNASGGPLPPGVQANVSDYADDTFVGKRYTFDGVPIEAFSQGSTVGETLSIQRVGDTFQVTGEVDLTKGVTGSLQPGAAQLAKSMQLQIAIAFPGPIIQQTGGTVVGNTVTWTPVFGQKTELQATGGAIGTGGQGVLTWILIGLAVLVVVIVAVILFRRRRSIPAPAEPEPSMSAPPAASQTTAPTEAVRPSIPPDSPPASPPPPPSA